METCWCSRSGLRTSAPRLQVRRGGYGATPSRRIGASTNQLRVPRLDERVYYSNCIVWGELYNSVQLHRAHGERQQRQQRLLGRGAPEDGEQQQPAFDEGGAARTE